MRYVIEHETRLTFPASVKEHHCEMRLTPLDDELQHVHEMRLEVEPNAELFSYLDSFGNVVHHCGLVSPHDYVTTRVYAEVETLHTNPFDYLAIPPARERDWIQHSLRELPRLWDFVVHRSAATPNLRGLELDLALPAYDAQRPLIECVQQAMAWVKDNFTYDPDVTHVHTSLDEVLALKAGVCQDFAHLLIAIVRSWGFPARYVMGYQDPGYSEEEEAEKREEGETRAQATHAWAEVLIPGAGWRGFDATHALVANDTYIRVAVGREHRDAAPQRGSFKGDEESTPPDVRLAITPQQ